MNINDAFLKYNDIIFKAAAPAYSTVAAIAAKAGAPHCRILSTTPNNLDIPEGAHCHELINDSAKFQENLYDYSIDDIRSYVKANSTNDFLHVKYTWRELNLNEAWYRTISRQLLNDTLIIKREVDLEWTKASDNSVFNEDQLTALESSLQNSYVSVEDFTIIPETISDSQNQKKYSLYQYEELYPQKKYLIGADIGGGFGKDFSTLVFYDPIKELPVAIFKSNKISTDDFRLLVLAIHAKYNKSIFILENNSYGLPIITNLAKRIPNNLYYDYKLTDKEKSKFMVPKKDNITYGFSTNTVTRPAMLDILKNIMENEPQVIRCKEIYEDIKGLEYSRTGKIEHSRTSHDDVLFGYLFIRHVLKYSNTISHFLRDVNELQNNINTILNDGNKTIGNNDNTINQKIPDIDIMDYIKSRLEGSKKEEFYSNDPASRIKQNTEILINTLIKK